MNIGGILLEASDMSKMVFEPRIPNSSFFAMLVFFGGAIVVALARIFQRDIFVVLAKSSFLLHTSEDLSKDGEDISPIASTLLTLQFFGIFSYLLYAKFLTDFHAIVIHLALPVYILYTVITIWLLTRILNNNTVLFREIQHFTFSMIQVVGLIYLIMIFVDYYHPFIPTTKTILLLIPVAILFAARILRSTVLAWRENMPWYYIILYFWTLEILPVMVAAKLLFPEWFREWIG